MFGPLPAAEEVDLVIYVPYLRRKVLYEKIIWEGVRSVGKELTPQWQDACPCHWNSIHSERRGRSIPSQASFCLPIHVNQTKDVPS